MVCCYLMLNCDMMQSPQTTWLWISTYTSIFVSWALLLWSLISLLQKCANYPYKNDPYATFAINSALLIIKIAKPTFFLFTFVWHIEPKLWCLPSVPYTLCLFYLANLWKFPSYKRQYLLNRGFKHLLS